MKETIPNPNMNFKLDRKLKPDPYIVTQETVIVAVNTIKARQAGIETGMKIIFINQKDKVQKDSLRRRKS